jgi:hypothetical protein
VWHGEGAGPRWEWNGDPERPTFRPSVLVQYPHLSAEARARNEAFKAKHGRWMTDAELPYDRNHVCHSFVTNGRIEFLSDCTHGLAGQTVDLPAMPARRVRDADCED